MDSEDGILRLSEFSEIVIKQVIIQLLFSWKLTKKLGLVNSRTANQKNLVQSLPWMLIASTILML